MAAVADSIQGTWHTVLPPLEIMLGDRPVASALAKPPELAEKHHVATVRWSYRLEPQYREAAIARLCHPARCVRIRGTQGYVSHFEGLDAEQPLWFEFQRSTEASLVKIRDLQLFVQYR